MGERKSLMSLPAEEEATVTPLIKYQSSSAGVRVNSRFY